MVVNRQDAYLQSLAYVSPGVYPNCPVCNLEISWHFACDKDLRRGLKVRAVPICER